MRTASLEEQVRFADKHPYKMMITEMYWKSLGLLSEEVPRPSGAFIRIRKLLLLLLLLLEFNYTTLANVHTHLNSVSVAM